MIHIFRMKYTVTKIVTNYLSTITFRVETKCGITIAFDAICALSVIDSIHALSQFDWFHYYHLNTDLLFLVSHEEQQYTA